MFRKHPRLTIALVIILGAGLVCTLSRPPFLRNLYDNLILDNKGVYLGCDELPETAAVKKLLQEHQDVVTKIQQIHPGFVFVDVYETENCPDKSFVLIGYASHDDRVKIEQIIGGDNFYGVPYKLENR